MLVVYDSKTGNVQRFINKLVKESPIECIKIHSGLMVQTPFVLVTYTTKVGQIPLTTEEFLANNYSYLMGVSSSGNMNWGINYGRAADKIAKKYSVPVLTKFELSGTNKDVLIFLQEVSKIGNS